MLTDDGFRVLECENTSVWAEPDLTDPATLGCLLHLVRGAWSDVGVNAYADCLHGRYVWRMTGGHSYGATFINASNKNRGSEGESLVAMLEAANVPHSDEGI